MAPLNGEFPPLHLQSRVCRCSYHVGQTTETSAYTVNKPTTSIPSYWPWTALRARIQRSQPPIRLIHCSPKSQRPKVQLRPIHCSPNFQRLKIQPLNLPKRALTPWGGVVVCRAAPQIPSLTFSSVQPRIPFVSWNTCSALPRCFADITAQPTAMSPWIPFPDLLRLFPKPPFGHGSSATTLVLTGTAGSPSRMGAAEHCSQVRCLKETSLDLIPVSRVQFVRPASLTNLDTISTVVSHDRELCVERPSVGNLVASSFLLVPDAAAISTAQSKDDATRQLRRPTSVVDIDDNGKHKPRRASRFRVRERLGRVFDPILYGTEDAHK